MENFIAFNPTKVIFGENCSDIMNKSLIKYGEKALILYGKESAKKYGYFEKIVNQLTKANIKYFEFGGIKANPIVDDVVKATEVCKKEKIDFIIALGGGSVIDSAKIIALAYANNEDPWKIMKYEVIPKKSVPIIVVLTFAGTGSEMNGAAVIQNHKTHEKLGYVNILNYPSESYLDPNFTLSVPKDQTAYGIVDMIAHSLEAFFAYGDSPISDRFICSLISDIMETAPLLLNNLQNYNYRARIMWNSTLALNGTLSYGKKSSGDWGVHSIGHVLSYLFDTPHGATLSIAYPAWFKLMKDRIPERIENLGLLISGEKISADKTIEIFETFFKSIASPTRIKDIEICKNDFAMIEKYLIHTKASGMNHKLDKDDYKKIMKFME